MKSVSELLDMQSRGEDIAPNPENKITKKRKGWKAGIIGESGRNRQAAYTMAMSILENYMPRLQEFVLTHGEEPAPELPGLVQQVYQLRQQDIKEAVEILDYDNESALTHLEDQENTFIEENGYTRDEFLGELYAPIEVAYSYLCNTDKKSYDPDGYDPDGYDPDGFAAQDLAAGIIPMIGEKVNHSTLIRAAQGKNAGILGALSTGGKRHYEALVAYFRKYPEVAKDVLDGKITDESMLPNWIMSDKVPNKNPLDPIRKQLLGDSFKDAIPYIIGFLLLIGVIVYFAARSKK